jgi:hypothetical protein
MAEIIIGGETLSASLPNYRRFKAAWQYLAPTQGENLDFTESVDAILGIIAVGLDTPFPDEPEPLTDRADSTANVIAFRIDYLTTRLTASELGGLKPFVTTLLAESGLDPSGLPDPTPAAALSLAA